MRCHPEPWQSYEVMIGAEALDIHLSPQVSAAARLKGPPLKVMTPGQHAKHARAGARHLTTGALLQCRGAWQPPALCRDGRTLLEHAAPTPRMPRINGVVDPNGLPQAQDVGQWIARLPHVCTAVVTDPVSASTSH